MQWQSMILSQISRFLKQRTLIFVTIRQSCCSKLLTLNSVTYNRIPTIITWSLWNWSLWSLIYYYRVKVATPLAVLNKTILRRKGILRGIIGLVIISWKVLLIHISVNYLWWIVEIRNRCYFLLCFSWIRLVMIGILDFRNDMLLLDSFIARWGKINTQRR